MTSRTYSKIYARSDAPHDFNKSLIDNSTVFFRGVYDNRKRNTNLCT